VISFLIKKISEALRTNAKTVKNWGTNNSASEILLDDYVSTATVLAKNHSTNLML
jgi:hypothetical protein